jgi:hypothetical protein
MELPSQFVASLARAQLAATARGIFSIIAEANSDVFSFCAPSIILSKS